MQKCKWFTFSDNLLELLEKRYLSCESQLPHALLYGMLKAPPVYRPCPARELLVQAKKPTVGSPPVYRPCPPREAVQLKPAPWFPHTVIQRSKTSGNDSLEVARENLETLQEYRSNTMKTLERKYINAGLSILTALQEWGGGTIPGHGSSKGDKDSGEQPGTTNGCNAALEHLQSWLKSHKGISTEDDESITNNNNSGLYDESLHQQKKEGKQKKKETKVKYFKEQERNREQQQLTQIQNRCQHQWNDFGVCTKCKLYDAQHSRY